MYIPEDVVADIRTRNDIVDVVGGYINLKKTGASYMALCPFHSEKTPSFSVSPGRQMYYCFGCKKGGNVITFLMEYDNMTFREAMKVLADRAGVVLPENDSREARQERTRRDRMLEAIREAGVFYFRMLRSDAGQRGMEYFTQRGLTPQTIDRFGLGYAGKGYDGLTRYLQQKGFDLNLLRDASLTIIDEKNGPRDRFFNRVMFPIQDINKKLIGFGGRVMGDGEPKYLNSSESDVFLKGRNLYGMHYAKAARVDNIILCEGYMDVIALHQAGFSQAVASLGTALTPAQASLIGRISKKAFICYDSDGAGTKAALKAIDILRAAGIDVKLIDLSPYKDPDELIKAKGADEFGRKLETALSVFDYRMRHLEKGLDLANPDDKTKLLKNAAVLLAGMEDELDRENHLTAICERYKISDDIMRRRLKEEALAIDMNKERERVISNDREALNHSDYSVSPGEREKKDRLKRTQAQRLLLNYISTYPGIYTSVREYISPEDFCDELCKRTAVILFRQLETGSFNPAGIVDDFDVGEESSFVSGIFFAGLNGSAGLEDDDEEDPGAQKPDGIIKDLLIRVRTESYNRYVGSMSEGDMKGDPAVLKKIIQYRQDLEKLKRMEIRIDYE